MTIEEHIPLLDEILVAWTDTIGRDFPGYRNHVYRMANFCLALRRCTPEEREKVVIAAAFHDIGIWTRGTLDYLPPSIAAAREYLERRGAAHWTEEIALMIDMHHKLRPFRDARYPLVEPFRQADLVDLSLGIVKCGLPGTLVRSVQRRFPNAGFHRMFVRRGLPWIARHPTNPLPIFKW